MVLAVGLIACLAMGSLISLGADWAESWGEGDLESLEASRLRDSAFVAEDEGGQSFILLVHHESLDDSSDVWQSAVKDALSKFTTMDEVTIQYSWDIVGDERDEYVFQGDDGFWAKNRVTINEDRTEAKQLFADNKESIDMDDDFESWRTGEIAIDVTFDTRIQDDLIKAELISGPLTVIILGIVFGTIISALLPFAVAVLTVLSAVGLTIWLSNTMDVTVYALNIITLIGIGVSVDYSLFLVNRFREELNRGRDIRTSTAMTVATAGKAVFFSGITVAIGLMGMLFFENTGLPSLGIGGTLAVSVAMIFSVIVLPAFMAILGHRVFFGKIPYSFSTENDDGTGIWAKIATTVMDKPWAVLIPTLVILLGAGLPFLYADFSIASRDALPPDDETRVGFEHMDEKWPEGAVNVAMVVLDFDGEDPLDETNLRATHKWMIEQIDDNRVITAFGYALPDASMNESSVVAYWQTPDEYLTEEQVATREYLRDQFLSNGVTYIIFSLNGPITGEDGRGFVADVREDRMSSSMTFPWAMRDNCSLLVCSLLA